MLAHIITGIQPYTHTSTNQPPNRYAHFTNIHRLNLVQTRLYHTHHPHTIVSYAVYVLPFTVYLPIYLNMIDLCSF